MHRLRTSGFTLVELMIVLVVIGVLAAVAYPSYESFMARSRRSDAQQLLSAVAARQAQYMLNAREYTHVMATGGLNVSTERWTCNAAVPQVCSNPYYSVSVLVTNTATPPTFKVTAAAQGRQTSDGHLTIDHTGAKERRVGGTGPNLGW